MSCHIAESDQWNRPAVPMRRLQRAMLNAITRAAACAGNFQMQLPGTASLHVAKEHPSQVPPHHLWQTFSVTSMLDAASHDGEMARDQGVPPTGSAP